MSKHLKYLTLLLFFQSFLAVIGQNAGKTASSIQEASNGIDYSNERVVNQKKEKEPEQEKAKKKMPEKQIRPKTEKGNDFSWLAKIFLIVISVLLLAIILFSVFKNTSINTTNKTQVEIDAESREFAEMDLSKSLSDFEQEGNYRLACRVLYLQLLQDLVMWNAIIWRNEKTNWDYYKECEQNDRINVPQLREITERYDLLWYGQEEPSQAAFESFQSLIASIRTKL